MRRRLRQEGFTYRRARRVPPKRPDTATQERTQRALARMHRLEALGRCRVLYADESGFCLQPPVPYLWQKKGETIGLPSHSHSERLNVVAFLDRKSQADCFLTCQTVTADNLVYSLDKIAQSLTVPTVVVLDNASVHVAKIIKEKRAAWKKQGLRLFYLPPYCPHLNKAEILWRRVKYNWLAPDDYASFSRLCESVEDKLAKLGQEYYITFD